MLKCLYCGIGGLFLGLLFLVTSPALAQQGGTVQGTVTDQDGVPINGAQVTIVGFDFGTTTNSNGFYQLSGVPTGQQTVRVSSLGYQTAEKTVDVVAGETVTVDFTLQPPTGTIQGTVYVAGTDQTETIPDATVTVVGTNLSATTNSNGFYQITDVPADTQTVRADAFGYQAQERTVNVVENETITENFSLLPAQPQISVTPPEVLDFGPVPVGDASTDEVIIENTGEVEVNISSISIPPPSSATGTVAAQGFSIVSGGGAVTLQPGDTHTVNIQFAPTSGGGKFAQLEIFYAPENRRTIGLDGGGFTATTGSASSVTATSATLHGSVQTGGAETKVTFEYGPAGGSMQTITADQSPIFEIQSVSATVSGLEPATEYVFRVKASNSGGTVTGDDASFTTDDGPPSARTDPAANVTTTGAILQGNVNPNGAETTVTFEYGLSNNYGSTIAAEQSPLTGAQDQAVSAAIDGLEPGTTYHYRVVAENSLGATPGSDQTFTTKAPAIELSPAELAFGEVGLGNSSEAQQVVIENTGNATLSITGVSLTDTTNFKKRDDTGETTLEPGATRTLLLAFAPQSRGDKTAELVVESELAGTASASLSGTGVQLGIAVTPDVLDLGTVAVGDTTSGQITIENTGEGTLEIAGVTLSGANSGDFAVVGGGGSGSLEPGATRAVIIQFAPSSEGEKAATFEVDNNAEPASADVRGTGEAVPPEATTLEATKVRSVNATLNGRVYPGGGETTVQFEYEPAAGGEMQTVVADQSPVTGAEEVDVSAGIEGLESGVEYVFRVVASNSAGSDTGNDRSFTTLAPELTVRPSSLDFGRVAVGDTTTGQITIENTGDADLEVTALSVAGSDAGAFSPVGSVGGILPGQEQTLAIQFIPSEGGAKTARLDIESNAGSVSVDLSGEAAVIEFDPTQLDPVSGEAEAISATVPEGFQPTERTLYYRRGGEPSYQSKELSLEGGGRVTGEIPASAVTPRGVDFYVELSDGDLTLTFPEQNPAQNPFHARTRFEGVAAGGSFAARRYRMVSVPAAVENGEVRSVFSAYGAINPSQWRLLRWTPAAEAYREGTAVGSVVPGRAFWLITQSGEGFDVSGRSVDASGPFELQLAPGYNQVGTPFAFPVAWAQLDVPSGVEAPIAYESSATDGDPYRFGVEVLDPWSGYWVYNGRGEAVTVSVPPVEASAALARASSKQGTGAEQVFGTRPVYAVQLVAREDGQERRDAHNWIGFAEGAHLGRGPEDVAEPPPIDAGVRLSVMEGGARLAGSLRPSGTAGQTWTLNLSAARSESFGQSKSVQVTVREQGRRPDGHELRVLDSETGRTLRVGTGSFRVRLTPEQPTRSLRVVVGTVAYTEAEAPSVKTTALEALYPNPFHEQVKVAYRLAETGRVEVAVYDVLGRKVQVLASGRRAAGRYEARWDGRTETGGRAASGIYVVRMQVGDYVAARRAVLIR